MILHLCLYFLVGYNESGKKTTNEIKKIRTWKYIINKVFMLIKEIFTQV